MPKRIAVILVVLAVLFVALSLHPFAPDVARADGPPIASLAAIMMPDGTSAGSGVYVGHGLVLTNWHPWTVAGASYLESTPAPSREVPLYLADGRNDPAERALGLADCDGALVPVDAAGADCLPLARIKGARFRFPLAGSRAQAGPDAEDELAAKSVPVQRLLYASQEHDLALFEIDERAVEALGVPAARLTMVPPGADDPVVLAVLGEDGAALDAVLRGGDPQILPTAETPALPAPWRVASLVAETDQIPALGAPVFAAGSGDLIGLAWNGAAGETWITPTAVWIHALYAANDAIRSDSLAEVLAEAVAAPVDAPPTMGDPLIPTLGNAGIDVQHVTLRLDLDPDAGMLAGVATLRIRAIYHQLASFSLDAYALDIRQVTVDGEAVPFVATDHKLAIRLPAPLDYGTEFEVAVTYAATPQPYHSAYIPYFDIGMLHADGRMFAYNEPDAAHTWFPCNDHPRDRATYDFYLRVDAILQAIANGVLVETAEHDDGTHTFHWRMAQPMASYLVQVVAGDYVVVGDKTYDDIAVRNYVYPGQETVARIVFGFTDDALVIERQMFGDYPYVGYGHVVVPHQGIALETQSLTTMPDSVLDTSEEAVFIIMVHELSHQWFGNAVPLANWSEMWLKEGLATYTEWLMLAQRYGDSAATAARSTSEQTLFTDRRTTPLIAPAPGDLLGVASYDKGAWLVHMLRQQIGDEAFFQLLREYVATYTDRPVSSLDFWRLAEQVSGQDLGAFFEQWLLQGGIPQMTLYWSATSAGADVLLCPSGLGSYRFALPLRFADGSQRADTTFDVAPGPQRASLPLDFAPTTLQADPDQLVLAQVQVQPIAALPEACPAGDM